MASFDDFARAVKKHGDTQEGLLNDLGTIS